MKLKNISKRIIALLTAAFVAISIPVFDFSAKAATTEALLEINEVTPTKSRWSFPVAAGYGTIDWSQSAKGGKSDSFAKVTIGTESKETRAQLSSWTKNSACNYLVLSFQIMTTDASALKAMYWGTNSSISISGGTESNASGANAQAFVNALVKNRWNTMTTVYNISGKTASTYINGKAITNNIATGTAENKRIQLHFYGDTAGAEFYLDNIYVYQSSDAPGATELAMPTLQSGSGYEISDNANIIKMLPDSVTVSALQAESGCTVRAYSDNTFASQLASGDYITEATSIVVEKSDGSLSYYTAEEAESEDILNINSASPTAADWSFDADITWNEEDKAGKDGTAASVALADNTSLTGALTEWAKNDSSKYVSMSFQMLVSDAAELDSIMWKNDDANVSGNTADIKSAIVSGLWNTVTTIYNLSENTAETYVNGVKVIEEYDAPEIVNSPIKLYVSFAESGAELYIDNIHIYQTDVSPLIVKPEIKAGDNFSAEDSVIKFTQGEEIDVDSIEYTSGAELRVYTESFDGLLSGSDLLEDKAVAVLELNGVYAYYTVAEDSPFEIEVLSTVNGAVEADKSEAFAGETVTLTVTPDDEYEIDYITVNDGDVILSRDFTFTMPAENVVIEAGFAPKEAYSITVSKEGKGTVSLSHTSAISGKTVTVTAAPESGYSLKEIKVNGSAIEGNTFVMPESAVVVTVVFGAKLVDNENPSVADGSVAFWFDSSVEGFTSSNASNPLSQEDGSMILEAGNTSSQVLKSFDEALDGEKFYGIKIRMKVENASKSEGYDSPTLIMYYKGTNKSTSDVYGYAEARIATLTLDVEEGTDGKFSGDYVTYYIDTTKITNWSVSEITDLRFDFLKNTTGTAYIDYIVFVQNPSVDAVRYDRIEDAACVMADADSIEFYLSTPVYAESITASGVKIYNELGREMELSSVKYDSESNAIIVKPRENIKAETQYVFEITNILINSSSTDKKSIDGAFKTGVRPVTVSGASKTASGVQINVTNSSTANEDVLLVAAVYSGDSFVRYKAVKVSAASGESSHTIATGALTSGQHVEIYAYVYDSGSPKLITNDVWVLN